MPEKRGLIAGIIEWIGKDTKSMNESKKLIVIIRILLLSIACYCVINGVIFAVLSKFISVSFFAIFFVICAGLLIMSYNYKTLTTLCYFNVSVIAFIVIILEYYGWDTGVQHFLIMLLVLCFFSSYKQYVGKILYAAALCMIRLILFMIYQNRIPPWGLSNAQEDIVQVVNTVTIFWCISIIAFIFSNNAQNLEGKLVEYNNQLQKQANTDTLTGLYNRRKALEYLEEMCRKEYRNIGFCISICDIDFFKKVNDTYGHEIGDRVLKQVANKFLEKMHNNGFVARWGGEEFLLVFPECNGDDAYIKLEDIRKEIKDMKIQEDNYEFSITMTFGLAEYDFQNNINAVIIEADNKLYMGKERGRDIVIF
ncbi:MAG: GGDEF domain-containing protein [Lachnospiraceae bacterium]|nr:GGDEF domain-containing protein [Lachnospiraceae bacterium]